MFKRRVIAVLYLKDGWMVRSEEFSFHHYIGDPCAHVERMVQWDVDELVVLDIGAQESRFDHHRIDYRLQPVTTLLELVKRIGVECHIPLTFGGRVRSLLDIENRILNGADKVTLNTALMDQPGLVDEAARTFGSQAIVASIDYRVVDGVPRVFVGRGKTDSGRDAVTWARLAEDAGAGEILLNAIDRDGMAEGYDIETIIRVADSVAIPVICCGGAGSNEHFLDALTETPVSAVAAGNFFHFKENAYPRLKAYLRERLEDIR